MRVVVHAIMLTSMIVLSGCARPQGGSAPDVPATRPLDVPAPLRDPRASPGLQPTPPRSTPTPVTSLLPVPVGRLMGTGSPGYSGDGGPAWMAALSHPSGVTLRRGEILVSDTGNSRIRRIDADGLASTWLGPDPSIDPPLSAPTRIVADDLSGLVFFSEPVRGLVRCVDIEGRVVTVLGGGAIEASDVGAGVSGRDVKLHVPGGLALDPSGRLLVADAGAHVVWQVDLETGWRARVLAGTGQPGGLGDGGPAIVAQLDGPVDVQVSGEGEVWVVEETGHRVRRIRTDGVIERVAGTGLPGRDPDGLPALRTRLKGPTAVLPGPDSSLFVADRGNGRLVRVNGDGTLTTEKTEVTDPVILAKGTEPQVLVVDPSRHELHVLMPEPESPTVQAISAIP